MSMILLYRFDFATCTSSRIIASCLLLLLIGSSCSNPRAIVRSSLHCSSAWLA